MLKANSTILSTAAIAAVLLGTGTAYAANPVVYDNWQSGNAASECALIGSYVYSGKYKEGDEGEGAPNGSDTFDFYDIDNILMHQNTVTITGSDGKTFNWSSTPNSIGAVIVKAGTGANVWFYDPQVSSDTGLYGYENKDVSHITFCWNPDEVVNSEWCSPGYWRQPQHFDSWPEGYSQDDKYSKYFDTPVKVSKLGASQNAPTDPTLLQVLQNPQWYGGDAFNAIGDLLSTAHPDVDFTGDRVEDSCPLN